MLRSSLPRLVFSTLFVIACCLPLLGAAPVSGAEAPGASGPDLGPDALTLTFTLPAYAMETDQAGFTHITVDGFGNDLTPGRFLLPVQDLRVALPPDAVLSSVAVSAVEVESETLPGSYRVAVAREASPDCSQAPSNAPICAPAAAGRAETPASDPAPLVSLARTGQMRKWMNAVVRVAPFQLDPTSGALTVTRSALITVTYDREPDQLDARLLQDAVMDDLAQRSFTNADAAQAWYDAAAQATAAEAVAARAAEPDSTIYDYVIITTNDIVEHSSQLAAFEHARELRGDNVWIVTETAYDTYTGAPPNTRADRIRQFLQATYVQHGIEYVLLIGDPDPVDPNDPADFVGDVPMKMTYPRLHETKETDWPDAPTDVYYADLTGDWDLDNDELFGVWPEDVAAGGVDLDGEVSVGRIPSYLPRDYAALDEILADAITFMNRSFWTDDYRGTQALLPMSFSAAGYDGAQLAEELKPVLTAGGFTNIWTMYQQDNGRCANSALPSSEELDADAAPVVANRWAGQPFGLVVWWGHGSAIDTGIGFSDSNVPGDCWDGQLFASADAQRLNDATPAFVFMNSCLNGTAERFDSMGYSVLANGAVATVSASRVSWFSRDQANNFHVGDTNASLAMRFSEEIISHNMTAGLALYMVRATGAPGSASLFANYLVFNLYGDPALGLINEDELAAPNPPVNFQITETGAGGWYTASWSDNSISEEGFRLEKRREDWTAWSSEPIVGAGVRSTTFLNQSCGRVWYYRVVAFNDMGEQATGQITIHRPPCEPLPPVDVSAALQPGGIELTWTAFNYSYGPETGFRIYRHPYTGGAWQQLAEVTAIPLTNPPTPQTYLDAALECDKTHEYMIKAINAAGESESSDWVHSWSGSCPPGAPTNLHQVGNATHAISFAWQDNSTSETRFYIQRKETADSEAISLPSAPQDATSYTDADPPLPCGAMRWYRVGAAAKYEVAWSGWLAMTTLDCSGVPTAPSGLSASTSNSADPTHVYLSWTDNSDNETGFEIQRSVSGGSFTKIGSVGTNQTTYHDPGNCSTAPRRYRVRAYNAAGNSIYFSNLADATLADCNPYGPVLTAVLNDAGTVSLSWTNQTAPNATTDSFTIKSVIAPFQYGIWTTLVTDLPASARSYTHTSPSCDRTHFYLVQAIVDGQAYVSDMVSIDAPPCQPTGLETSGIGQTGLTLHWDDRSETEAGFRLYRRPPGIGYWTVAAEAAANVEHATVSGLGCGAQYRLAVASYRLTAGERVYSALSDGLDIATLPCTPAAPTNVSVTAATAGSISLQWTSASTPVDGFRILRSEVKGFSKLWVEVGEVPGQTLTFTDETAGLECGQDYSYAVRAFNTGGVSGLSTAAAGGTRPCAPAAAGAKAVSPVVVLMKWTDNSANETGFIVQDSTGPTFLRSDVVHRYDVEAGASEFRVPLYACGQPLYYRLFAENGYGSSTPSNVSALTVQCLPPAPAGLTWRTIDNLGAPAVSLTWKHSGQDADGFMVATSTDGSADWRDIAKVPATQSGYMVLGLRPGSVRYFRVRAFNSVGQGAASNTVLVLIAPADMKRAGFLPMIRR